MMDKTPYVLDAPEPPAGKEIKMKRTMKLFSLTLALLMMLSMMTACGGGAPMEGGAAGDKYFSEDMAETESVTDGSMNGSYGSSMGTGGADGAEAGDIMNTNPTEKMIYSADVYAQTLDYDAAVKALKEAVASVGGYIESYSESNGGSYYSSNYYEGGGRRSANYTIRIPAAQFEGFLSGIAAEFNVIDQQLYSENVTLQYVDMEARIKSLTAQQDRLLELLGEAENLDQILAIEKELTSTRSEIESITSSLRVLESRVSYSTVNLYINETTIYTPGAEDSFFQRVLRSFGRSWDDLREGAEDLTLYVASHFLQLILWAVVIFAAWRIIRKKGGIRLPRLRRKKNKKAPTDEEQV